MPIPNRELSQFGSFLYVDNASRNIGIATTATPYVGIGTTNPFAKLTVIGDTNISGVVSATGYYLNGNPLVSAAIQTWDISGSDIYRGSGNVGIGSSIPGSKLTVAGDITATGAITGSNISVSGISISSGIITASQFYVTSSSPTPPFVLTNNNSTLVPYLNANYLDGAVRPSGSIVGTTDSQTLTNKTLTSPIISSPIVSSAGIAFSGSTSGTTTLRASSVAVGILTLPATTDILVARNTTDTLTNKTIAAGSNTITDLTNSNLSGSAGITNANLATPTISGISLGGNLANLTAGSYINYSSGTTYNGSSAITLSVNASSSGVDNIIARNASGGFNAGIITCTYLYADFTVEATDFNSVSDINLKQNVQTVENALDVVNNLRGVRFDWKKDLRTSYGVIAQELEKVIPDLVNLGKVKSVNYNGLIGVLIEAVKELSQEVEKLKKE